MRVRVHILGIMACAIISVTSQADALARPATLTLEARIAEVKAKGDTGRIRTGASRCPVASTTPFRAARHLAGPRGSSRL
jgi:hypothetical protein